MDSQSLKARYFQFFAARGHRAIPSAPLLPENDPTALFTSAGMQPLLPYLLGEPHPLGRRLVNVQACLRTNDIDEVGDASHLTFFEMLGNWSLGDYFKAESLAWSYEFLTAVLGLPAERLSVTIFAGDADAPRDEESAAVWRGSGCRSASISCPKRTTGGGRWAAAGRVGRTRRSSMIRVGPIIRAAGPAAPVAAGLRFGTTSFWHPPAARRAAAGAWHGAAPARLQHHRRASALRLRASAAGIRRRAARGGRPGQYPNRPRPTRNSRGHAARPGPRAKRAGVFRRQVWIFCTISPTTPCHASTARNSRSLRSGQSAAASRATRAPCSYNTGDSGS